MNKTVYTPKGFTIVELLIVVVVIAILAAISIIAYSGIQERARTSTVNNAASSWTKLIRIQKEQNFTPPASTESCLGRSSADFPAENNFAAGECMQMITDGTPSESVYFVPGTFTTWNDSFPRPNGLLPVTTSTFKIGATTLTYRARGQFISTYSNALIVYWIPVVLNECGPGRGMKADFGEFNTENGNFSGDFCQIDLKTQ